MSPYFGASFFEFFALLFHRLGLLFTAQIAPASDEIQLAVLLLMSVTTALLGALLVLRKMTMLANALSHTILLGIVIAFLLMFAFSGQGELTLASLNINTLLIASFATALLTAFCIQWLSKTTRLFTDASIGLVFNVFFALGVLLITLFTRNTHLGVEAIMGSADALHINDLKLMAMICSVSVAVIILFFKEWHLTTFDAQFSYTLGFSPSVMGYALMVLTAGTSIAAFRIVGVFLVLGLLIFPTLIARLFCKRLKTLMISACAISCSVSLISVAISRHLLSMYSMPLSTAGLLIVCLCVTYCLAIGVKKALRKKGDSKMQELA